MKEVVIALLTTTINRYSEFSTHNGIVRDLTTILDYISDLKEETIEPITVVFNSSNEVDKLKKYIRELEDSCENMAQVERNLNAKIRLYEAENQRLNNICKQYIEREVK